jgi:16S rRNA processing protein RimM
VNAAADAPPSAFLLGTVLGPRGLKGELRVRVGRADPLYVHATHLTLEAREGRPTARLAVARARPIDPHTIVVSLDGVADRTAAEAWAGARVHAALADFPPGRAPAERLLGAEVVALDGRPLGVVDALVDGVAQTLLDVGGVWVPWVEPLVPRIEAVEGRWRVVVATMPGLFEPEEP